MNGAWFIKLHSTFIFVHKSEKVLDAEGEFQKLTFYICWNILLTIISIILLSEG